MTVLLASCGQRYQAKQLINDFVDDHAVAPEKIDNRSFGKLDSTLIIPDSVIQRLRSQSDTLFRKDFILAPHTPGQKLLYLRMRFDYEGEEMSKTFYFGDDLQGIIAIK